MPVVELPEVDLTKAVPPAEEQKAAPPLNANLSTTKFVVRFDVRRAADDPPAPEFLQVIVGQHNAAGRYRSIGDDLVRPTNSVKELIVHYEGVIRAPDRTGAALIEVRAGNSAYLVRSVHVK